LPQQVQPRTEPESLKAAAKAEPTKALQVSQEEKIKKLAFAKPPAKAVTGETITDAAVKLPSGEIYTGTSHPQIATELEEKGIKFPQTEKSQGFVTSEGRFVLRKEAGEIARKAKQLKKEGEVFAHDFGPYGIAKPAPSPAEAVTGEKPFDFQNENQEKIIHSNWNAASVRFDFGSIHLHI
jgi:hypothetical protein